jgi:hypothetical protein
MDGSGGSENCPLCREKWVEKSIKILKILYLILIKKYNYL